jgi:hypothetical protein
MNMETFTQKPFRVHSFLAEVPMHSLDQMELPGGDATMKRYENLATALEEKWAL